MPLIKKQLFFFLVILVLFPGCGKREENRREIKIGSINEKKIEIIETKKYDGFILGTNFENGEAFIENISTKKRVFLVSVIDLTDGQIKKQFELLAGTHQSPDTFFNPTFLESFDGRYYVIDQFSKIVVYNPGVSHAFSAMFNQPRFFLDFYKKKGDTFFVVGSKNQTDIIKGSIQVFRLQPDKRPALIKTLYDSFESKSIWKKNNSTSYYYWYYSPVLSGFEKDGHIYYARGDKNSFYRYNLDSGKTETFSLGYLKKKHCSPEHAVKMGKYKTASIEKRLLEKRNLKIIHEPYPEQVYHFGIFDIGKNKIGIVGAVFPATMEMRIDVFECVAANYQMSFKLPFSRGFIENISSEARGFLPTFVDIDRGIYVWYEEDEDRDPGETVMITRFKLIW